MTRFLYLKKLHGVVPAPSEPSFPPLVPCAIDPSRPGLNLDRCHSHEELFLSQMSARQGHLVPSVPSSVSHVNKRKWGKWGNLVFHWAVKYSELTSSVFLTSSPYPAHSCVSRALREVISLVYSCFPGTVLSWSHCIALWLSQFLSFVLCCGRSFSSSNQ